MGGWVDRQVGGWVDRQVGGWVDRQVGGWVGGWVSGDDVWFCMLFSFHWLPDGLNIAM